MNQLQANQLWIEQADAAIRKVNPNGPAVIWATRSFEVLGRDGVLTARLSDGTEWRIDGQEARQLTVDEIAARASLHESFQ
ncbi:hypothetical protein [Burkholderia cenocepacia]|uniref:hypothetical protein n=1 Tax=Burkholderia cenocepacia TaxID=95486 RepID=UPI0013DFE3E7|nr:hypothetical protein [Burkholderia cenocepacia]MCW3587335.1 hypothetical protein [Burkholderia cenocepacia]MCW3632539.1 hypothetical protein [Burkholderia cenocepacia]MCW5181769.1 hypothetical protein [Burkholderia cenocepacia]NGO98095.1 hypothetical protein [Burkholderia cenocepacia]